MGHTESIKIENVVGLSEINQELDLETLADDLRATKYDPDQFPGLVFRTEDPKAAVLIFHSGKIICTGAKGTDEVHAALDHVFEKFRELRLDVPTSPEVTIQNIVSSADLGQQLNLNAIAIGLGLENTEYEPEQFPGLVYRLDDPTVVALLFGSGKLVITGGQEPAQAEHALTNIEAKLTELGLLEEPVEAN